MENNKTFQLFQLAPPRTGAYTIITKWGKDIDWIINDPENITPAKIPLLVFPYGTSKVKLRWNEFVESEQAALEAVLPDGKTKKYIAVRTFLKSKLVIGTREEWVDILKIEGHPDVAEVISSDGGVLEMILLITVEVNNPIKAKALEDPLGQIHAKVIEIIREWASKKSFKEVRQIGASSLNELTVDVLKDGDSVTRPFLDVLNTDAFFTENKFKVLSANIVNVLVSEESKDLLETEENVGKQKNNAEAEVHVLAKTELEAKGTEARNAAELKLIQGRFAAKTKFINDSKDALVAINKAKNEGLPNGLKFLHQGGGSNELSTVESILLADEIREEDKKKGGNK